MNMNYTDKVGSGYDFPIEQSTVYLEKALVAVKNNPKLWFRFINSGIGYARIDLLAI